MKFCAVICEYNPFHNGHLYQLQRIREKSGCDKILCLMSGNFTQRGEAAVFHKSVRARHAVENGADAVIELPAVFSVSSAELFAGGAIHLLASLPAVTTLAFGCESGDREAFLTAAKASLSEDKEFKAALKENMKDGTSYAKAHTQTVLAFNTDVDESLLTSPNNILGVEYCKAILKERAQIDPLPLPRVGGGYADTAMFKNFSSAAALRLALNDAGSKAQKLVKKNVPQNVYRDAKNYCPLPFETAALAALVTQDGEKIAQCPDCSEGLENRLKAMTKSNPQYADMLNKVVSKRYTLSRLKRILAQALLKIRLKDVKEFLEEPLYLNLLALKKEGAEEVLAALGEGSFPVIARKSDAIGLKKDALDCFLTDVCANDLYNVLSGMHTNEYETLFL